MAKRKTKTERTQTIIRRGKAKGRTPAQMKKEIMRTLEMTEAGAHSFYYTNVNKV